MAKDRKLDRHRTDQRVNVSLRLDRDVLARLDRLAGETGIDRHSMIVQAVEEYLDREENPGDEPVEGFIRLDDVELHEGPDDEGTDCGIILPPRNL